MLAFTASIAGTLPLAAQAPVETRVGCSRIKHLGCSLIAVGVGKQLHFSRKKYTSITCYAAMDARCSASVQNQTLKREAPNIHKAPPVREPTKSPELVGGSPGPPGPPDGGGGGGGDGGGKWSGGFFLFAFLAFLGLLKDKEREYYK